MSEQLAMTFDVCQNRHKGSLESIAANPSPIAKSESYPRILALLAGQPMTSKEIARALGVELNCISGRCSELRFAGSIRKTGERREGAAVLEIKR